MAVSPQLPSFSKKLIDRHRLGFEILHDGGNETAEAYRLRFVPPEYLIDVYKDLGLDLEATNGDATWSLPLPARYIIDSMGIIRYARVNADYRYRPEPEETLRELRRFAGRAR